MVSDYRSAVIDAWIESINEEASIAEQGSNGHWEGECRERLSILSDYQALEAERDALRVLVKKSFEEGYENGMRSGTGEPFKLMHQEMMYEEWCGSEARQALKGGNDDACTKNVD